MSISVGELVFTISVDTEKAIAELDKLTAKAKELQVDEDKAFDVIMNNTTFKLSDKE